VNESGRDLRDGVRAIETAFPVFDPMMSGTTHSLECELQGLYILRMCWATDVSAAIDGFEMTRRAAAATMTARSSKGRMTRLKRIRPATTAKEQRCDGVGTQSHAMDILDGFRRSCWPAWA
jgi:hypothetical protein